MSDTLPTVAEELGISNSDLKALRNAETIVFRHSEPGRGAGYTVGSAFEAIKRHDPGDGFGQRELMVSIPVLPPKVTSYVRSGQVAGSCSVFSAAKFIPELQTALAFMKPGDILCAEYELDNNTQLAKDLHLHIDEVKLRIRRGDKVFVFMLKVLVSTGDQLRDVAFR